MAETIERKPMADAVSTIAWAFVILHLDFNLGRLNILGNWIGWWMIASAVKKLGEENPEFALLESLAIGLAVWDGVCNAIWLLLGVTVNIYAVNIVVFVLMLYLRFQLLTNLAEMAEAHGCPQRRQLLVLRTVQTLLLTAMLPLPEFAEGSVGYYITVAVNLLVAAWILLLLFSLRRSLGWTPPPKEKTPEIPPVVR